MKIQVKFALTIERYYVALTITSSIATREIGATVRYFVPCEIQTDPGRGGIVFWTDDVSTLRRTEAPDMGREV